MKKISIRQALIDAADETDAGIMRYEMQAVKWAKYIEGEIGSYGGYKLKAKAFHVTGSTIDLPGDCLQVLRLIHGDYEDDITSHYKDTHGVVLYKDPRATLEDVGIAFWAPADVIEIPEMMWEQIIDQLQLILELHGRTVTMIYMATETDPDGYWMVAESHIKAISSYIIYMYSKKKLWNSFTKDKMTRQNDFNMVLMYKEEYSRAIRNARAIDGDETELERRQY
jgi:hypothetical protein